ncbi:MAG: EamA family transporter, partial [Deltaproteobacteria bacterium]|nr:EamA family transporter [Deltaproteobacteria bacterium]
MEKNRHNHVKYYLLIICAAVLWASSGTASKYLFNSGMDPYALVHYRVSFSAIILGVYLLLLKPHLLKIRPQHLWHFAILGAGMGGVQFTYLFAISKMNVAIAILMQYMAPFFIAIYSFLFFKEIINRLKVFSIVMAFTGCFFAVEAYNVAILVLNWHGITAGLLSALFFSFYTVMGERVMRHYSPWTVLFYAFAFSGVYFSILLSPTNLFFSDMQFLWVITVLYVVVIGTAIPFGLFFMGIEYLRSTRASVVASFEPISAGIFSFIFLGEALTLWQV